MTVPQIPYEVAFNVYTDAKGKRFVIPSSAELTSMIEAADADIQRVQTREDSSAEMIALNVAELERIKAQRIALRDHYLPQCEVQTYTLVCPTYGEYAAYRALPGVRTLDVKSGSILFDDERLRDAILPKCVRGLTEAEVKALPPDVAARLWQELQSLVAPDAAALPIPA